MELKKERNYGYAHFYDWFHITENLKAQLKYDPNGK